MEVLMRNWRSSFPDFLPNDSAWAPIQAADEFLADCQHPETWRLNDPHDVRVAIVTAERVRLDYECTTLERWWRLRA
jgi:hypothetical protein